MVNKLIVSMNLFLELSRDLTNKCHLRSIPCYLISDHKCLHYVQARQKAIGFSDEAVSLSVEVQYKNKKGAGHGNRNTLLRPIPLAKLSSSTRSHSTDICWGCWGGGIEYETLLSRLDWMKRERR